MDTGDELETVDARPALSPLPFSPEPELEL